jgi:hypothetical protein
MNTLRLLFTLLLLGSNFISKGQLANDNTLSVTINGEKYQAPPRRIRIGNYWWITANSIKPDQSLRIWLGSYNNNEGIEPGTYLVVDADDPDVKANRQKVQDSAKYKGLAAIKYVKEIKEPRMEYHVGKSQNNDETITVKKGADGALEATFSGSLAGSYWKEKASATVFGGVGRLMSKIEDKAITKTTGYDSAIDPEGNGYKKQLKTDTIDLKDGSFRLKMTK